MSLQKHQWIDPVTGELYVIARTGDSASIDAFARQRVSNPTTLFDSKQIHDNQPLFWDDAQVSGTGTSSSHDADLARTQIGVSATTAGKRVRQTFQRFNYQPGKSQLIILTGLIGSGGTGLTQEIGYFDDNDGLFFRVDDGTLYIVVRSNATGTPVDTAVAQANWNLDVMDGTGPSRYELDLTKAQIFFLDFEWLGIGRIRFGFFIDGKPIYCHQVLNANNVTNVYMSTPNLPLRYSIENDGTGAAATLDHVCSTVISEGGSERTGLLRHIDSPNMDSLSAGTSYGAIGIRLKDTHFDESVFLETVSLISKSANDQAHWEIRFNPTVAGTFVYNDITNSAVQIATGNNTAVVTGGTEVGGGYFVTALPTLAQIQNALRIGANIAGTADTMVVMIRPITASINAEASLTWREAN